VAAQHRVLVPEYNSSASFARSVRNTRTARPGTWRTSR
jgi:hypothetical protein